QQCRLALDEQQRRRVRQLGQQRGVTGIVPHQQMVIGLLQPGQRSSRTFADRFTASWFGATGWQAQGAPGTGRGAERGRGIGEGTEQLVQATRSELWQQMKAQPRFELGGGNGRHMTSLSNVPHPCSTSVTKSPALAGLVNQGLRTLSCTASERVACSTRP